MGVPFGYSTLQNPCVCSSLGSSSSTACMQTKKEGLEQKAIHLRVMNACRSPGRIVETLLEDFTVLNGGGLLTVIVQNTGSFTADYSVCGLGLPAFYLHVHYCFYKCSSSGTISITANML